VANRGATGEEVRFARLAAALAREGRGEPALVVDGEALARNLARAWRHAGGRAIRLVVKSLPCAALLERAGAALGTRRFMAFHRPFVQGLLERWPGADVLLGKPLPVAAAREVYRGLGDGEATAGLTWLVDTRERLLQYLALAEEVDRRLRVALEIDVGLHRGGVPSPAALGALLEVLRAHADRLELGGLMGYDAHVAKAPWPGRPVEAARRADERYAAFVGYARERFGDVWPEAPILNGGGSPSFTLMAPDAVPNEVAIGSVLVKPMDFDLPQLADYEPAAYIAAPVLKRLAGVRLPFLEGLAQVTGARRDTLFLYGGRWMARPVWPPGMRASRLYGESSNQQMMTVPRDAAVGMDDYVFLRPTQSEAVLLQLGPLALVDGAGDVERWAVLDASSQEGSAR
jgi:D-serine deaminase-like pyridoxal phosphate-dependent protein